MIKLYPRWQMATIKQLMLERRVLLLSGVRQCGKTTLAHQLESDETEYRTLDDGTLREAAENDPQGFIKRNVKTLIIDEVQRVPPLLSAIKKAVDETVLGRLASPEDIANVVCFLCSEKSRHITGEVIQVDGGQYI